MSLHCRAARGILSRGTCGRLAARSSSLSSSLPSSFSSVATTPGVTAAATLRTAPPAVARGVATLSGGSILTQLAAENPYKDVVRYEFKNRKWNLQHVDYYSDALAIGLLENGLQPGDVVLSWLPAHFSESVSFAAIGTVD